MVLRPHVQVQVHLHHFSNIKSPKEVTEQQESKFSYYFCLMIEVSGSGAGSIPLTNGSGSRRPKNTCFRWIRIRIRNTAETSLLFCYVSSGFWFGTGTFLCHLTLTGMMTNIFYIYISRSVELKTSPREFPFWMWKPFSISPSRRLKESKMAPVW